MSKCRVVLKKFLMRVLPRKIYYLILARPVPALISKSLYRKLYRINRAALCSDPNFRGDWSGIIRKESHIIDKGLQVVGREAGHSLELAKSLSKNLSETPLDGPTKIWASEILRLHGSLQEGKLDKDFYSDFDLFCPDGDHEYLIALIRSRRSIRHFSFEDLPRKELIKEAIDTTVWAPSSCNRQTIVSFVTYDSSVAAQCAKQNKGATGISGVFSFVAVCYDTRSYYLPQESLTGLIDASLGFQNALLMFHALGLGACVLNWSHASKQEEIVLRSILGIPDYCEIAFNVVVGVPRIGAPPPGRKSEGEYMKVSV